MPQTTTRRPLAAIPAGTTDIEHALCNGTGGVHLPTDDGGVAHFVCTGCSACRRTVVVQVAVPAPTAEQAAAVDALRRRVRLSGLFDHLDEEDSF